MIKRAVKSFGHAREGFMQAFRVEWNFRTFLLCFIVLLILCQIIGLAPWEWVAILLAGSQFLCVELLNTALERLTDAVDDCHCTIQGTEKKCHSGLKATKDIAAAASLVSLIIGLATMAIVLLPRIIPTM